MEKQNISATKKISKGHYIHIATGLHIVFCMGEISGYWNIWEDEQCTKEWYCSIPTKWQAIEKIEKYSN
jgi:hypothetical protein